MPWPVRVVLSGCDQGDERAPGLGGVHQLRHAPELDPQPGQRIAVGGSLHPVGEGVGEGIHRHRCLGRPPPIDDVLADTGPGRGRAIHAGLTGQLAELPEPVTVA